MACEVLYVPATTGDMPKFLTKVNAKGTPSAALTMVSLYVQLMLILRLFVSNALDFILDLTAALAVIPYRLAAGYALKLTLRRETYDDDRSLRTDKIVATLAIVYTAFLVYAAGPKHLLFSCLLYAPATLLYARARASGVCGCSPHRSWPCSESSSAARCWLSNCWRPARSSSENALLFRAGSDLQAGQFGGSVEQQAARFPDRAAKPASEVFEVGVDVAPLPRQRHRQHVRRQMGAVAVQLDLVPA